jgi:hypothetical protein
MNLGQAKAKVLALWGHSAESRLGGPVHVNDSLTEEYSWGWVLHLTLTDPAAVPLDNKRALYAVARETGDSTPVGTKGLREAIEDLFGPNSQ